MQRQRSVYAARDRSHSARARIIRLTLFACAIERADQTKTRTITGAWSGNERWLGEFGDGGGGSTKTTRAGPRGFNWRRRRRTVVGAAARRASPAHGFVAAKSSQPAAHVFRT